MIALLPMHVHYLLMQFKKLVMATLVLRCPLHLSHTPYSNAI
jgi:hypothetical protein